MAVTWNNIRATIPVNLAIHTGASLLVCCGGIIPLAWHYLNKTMHLPKFMMAIYYAMVFIGGVYFLYSGLSLVREWINAAVPEQEVAPPALELPQLPRAPEP